MENHFKLSGPKSGRGPSYRKWTFTKGSNCEALTGKVLVFWIGGRLWEVVAYDRWFHIEVQLFFKIITDGFRVVVLLLSGLDL